MMTTTRRNYTREFKLEAIHLLETSGKSATQLERELTIGGKKRPSHAKAGAYCTVIRSIRRLQGREADFERYYQGLFATYPRHSALKEELRKAVEGSSYQRRR
jgi:hypothetical protein